MSPLDWKYQDESELEDLVGVFRELRPRRFIMEIGSMWGGTLRRWIEHADPGSTILAVDTLVPQSDPRYGRQREGHDITWRQWAHQRGHLLYVLDRNSRDGDCITIVKRLMPLLDFLFIDGGHDYATCWEDWINYGPLVRPGGVVAFHDLGTEWPDVRKVWDQARAGKVSREFCRSPHMYGIGALYV